PATELRRPDRRRVPRNHFRLASQRHPRRRNLPAQPRRFDAEAQPPAAVMTMIETPRRIPLLTAFLSSLILLHAGAARAWPTAIASAFEERGRAVATDREGNAYVAGTFDGVLSASDRTVTSNGERDVF